MQKRMWLVLSVFLIALFPYYSLNEVDATEVSQVETKGNIGFSGVYEPIGNPDPPPPENIKKPPITEIAKPGGSLPQTNEGSNVLFTWAGVSLLVFVFILWKRKKQQEIPKRTVSTQN
jgi:LPXTG-motif cell wall-anchored protein